MNKRIIVQFLILPFLIVFEIIFHEFGHAIMWYANGTNQVYLELVFPIKLTLKSMGNVTGFNRIMVSLMGPIFGSIFSLSGLIISNKSNLKIFKVCFQALLLSEIFQLIIPIGDLYVIQEVDYIFSIFVQIICFFLAMLLIIYLLRNIYKIIDDYFKSKIIISNKMIKFHENR